MADISMEIAGHWQPLEQKIINKQSDVSMVFAPEQWTLHQNPGTQPHNDMPPMWQNIMKLHI